MAIGKWGLQGKSEGPDWPAHPLKRGFDDFYGYIRHRDGHEHYPKEGKYRGPKEVWENYNEVSKELDKCYTGDLFTAKAKQYIIEHQEESTGEPFFMYLSFDTPHAVLELPTQAYPKGGGLKGGLQWLGTPGKMINTASGEIDSHVSPAYTNATYDHDNDSGTQEVAWPDVYKRYATVTKRIDDQVGDIIQLLKDLEIDENTLVVFTSDNGPSQESYLPVDKYGHYRADFFDTFGPFDGIKRDTYEGGLRTSTIAYWPRTIPAGSTVETPSISYDWMPTIAEAAGISAPVRSDGVSLLPSLKGAQGQMDSKVYVEYFNSSKIPGYGEFLATRQNKPRQQMQMVRLGNMVGVRYNITSHENDFEIYNVIKDPGQTNDLADKNPELQKRMKESVLRMRKPDSSAKRPYDDEFISEVKHTQTRQGLLAHSFRSDSPWIPQFDGRPVSTEVVSLPMRKMPKKGFVTLYSGFIDIPEDGEYTFFLDTDDQVFLGIHDIAVIDGDHSGEKESEGTVKLKAGIHPINLYHLSKRESGSSGAGLVWSYNGRKQELIPSSAYLHNPKL